MTTRPPEAHDVLVIPRLLPTATRTANGPTGMLKMSVREDGLYDPSVLVDATDEGARKVYGIARPGAPEQDTYGPAFAILPIRPDPGSQSDTCFLINTENLFLPNPWTAADWDAFDVAGTGQPNSASAEPDPAWPDKTPPFLVAGPEGKVFYIDVERGQIRPVTDIRVQTPIWNQLREGLIVGTVVYNDSVIPIFNVASLNLVRGKQFSPPSPSSYTPALPASSTSPSSPTTSDPGANQ